MHDLASQLRALVTELLLAERRGKAIRVAPLLGIADQLDELASAHAPLTEHVPLEVTVPVAALELGVSVATVRRWCAAGVLPARRAGRTWLVVSDLSVDEHSA